MGSVSGGRRLWPFKLAFVLGTFCAAGAVAAGVVSGADQPSITSDRSDYAPGDAVALSGAGWQAGEAVQLLVDDDQDDPWSHAGEILVGDDGTVSNSFDLPADLAGPFSVTASAVSGDASWTFTVTALSEPPPPTNPSCTATGDEALETDKAGYLPGAVVGIVGTGFGASCDAQVRITLPDETTSTETVATDSDGSFGSNYTLPAPAVAGEYVVEALGELEAVLASTTFEGLEPATGTPFIWTDRGDYKPGETFVLRGSGWLPGEAIQVVVDDDDGDTWLHTADVVAGADGTFTNQFQLPDWFVAVYTVTATGALSGAATTSFTDAIAFGGCGPFAGPPPHTITVNTTTDEWNTPVANGSCSLREAVRAANLDPGADTIVLPAGTYQLTRTGNDDVTVSGDLDVLQPVTISGGGARTTIVQAGTTTTNGIDRVFHITSAGTLTMSQVTVQFGRINNDGGGIRLDSSSGTALSLTDVTVRNNTATSGKDGGGISAAASLTLNRVTVSGNTANQHGGGLHLGGTTSTLTNVTVTDNTALQQGGGIRTNAGTTTLTNVTVSHNTGGTGGGIRRDSGAINLRNTIVSNNSAANCSGTIGNTSNNLDSGTTCGFGSASGSQSSTSVPPANAMLGALQDNGGPTDTRALGTGSTAIDRGTATSAPNHDQRNVARPQDGDGVGGAQHDVGAYEAAAVVQSAAPTVDSPICVGATRVSGTSAEAPVTTTIEVFKNGVSVGTTTVALGGTWTKTGLVALVAGDLIKARATATGKSTSADSNVVTVSVCNTAPVANDDAYSTGEDNPLNVAAPGVLVNDTDADGNTLTAVLDSGPANAASFTLNANGSFDYTPSPDFNGTDSFTYHANDGTANSNTATVTITVNPVNDAPVAEDDTATVVEDSGATAIDVLANDDDADGNTLTVSSVTDPANGTAVDNDTGVSYTPDANYCGADTFDYTVADGNGGTDTATVSVTVTCANDAPNAAADTATVDEDSAATIIDVLDNDTDADGDGLVVSSVTDPANGTAVDNDSDVSYTPDANFCGTDTFDYTVSDGNGGTDTATVTVTVTCVNDAPVAGDDAYAAIEDTQLVVAAPGVLANDTDSDDSSLTAELVDDVDNGTLALAADGSFTYDPDANYCGADSFTYRADDGEDESNVATVSITVVCVNDAPNAADDSATVAEDSGATTIDVLDNDTDADGDGLVVSSVTDPANGTAVDNDSDVSYTPAPNFCGTDTFDYTVSDGNGGIDTATVTVTVTCVNDPPVAADDAATVAEDSGATAIGVLANDDDADGDTLVVDSATDPANGTAVDNNTSISYTPDANFCGTDTFDYTVSDGEGGTDTAQVTVTVTCVNDPPVAVNDSYGGTEDTQLVVSAPGVLGNDTDVDDTALTAVLVGDVSDGTLALAADGSFTYDPDPDFCGADSFTYRANDGDDLSNLATVSLAISCVNDAPVANDDSYNATEDTQLAVTAPGVLGNDTDVEGSTLTATLVDDVSDGTLVLAANGSFTYDPDANFCGADSFTYRANDGDDDSNLATVSITVECVNDAPVAADDAATVAEDSGATAVDVLANDDDVEGDPLTVTAVTNPANGSAANNGVSVSYTPDPDYCGADSFDYTVSDGNGGTDTATVSITVTCVNDAPVANDDSYNATEDTALSVNATNGVLANDTDVDAGETLTAVLVSGPAHAAGFTLNANGSFDYTPGPNYCGPDSFTYRANDGEADSAVATVSLAVACVNDAPVANDDSYNATEDTALSVNAANGVLANDTDVDAGETLTAVLVSGPVHSASFTLDADGSFDYTPNANYCGPDSFTYRANDGEADSAIATASIAIACVNDAPVANDDSYNATEDTALSVNAANGVLANDTDVDAGETLTAVLVSGPAHAAGFTLNANGSFAYTPNTNYCGPDSFTYRASDGEAQSGVATASIAVACVNDAPVAGDDAETVLEDSGATTIDVLADDNDVDGDSLTVASVTQPAHGSAANNGTNVSYTPNPNYCGPDTFTYTVSDGNGGTDTATVSITVTCVNDVPVADAGGPYSGNEAATVQLDGSGSEDVEGPVTYSWTITPQTGSLNDPGPGASCSFVDGTTASSEKPKVSCTDDGIYDVSLTVTDSAGATDDDSTTLTLANVAPTVAKPTFDPTLIGCQTATTLKNISFSDPGTVDNPWTVDIDWGDGSPHTTYVTATQGAQPNQTHVYATAGTFTATVSVTDKDLDTGSNTSSTTTTVYPYTVEFRPPVDGSTAANSVVNKMKNGRVVPIKVRIRDLCGGTDMLDPSAQVTIKVTKSSGTSGVGDPVEEYADAGNSSGGTDLFRHGGDHWIYNLDSKALGFVINNRYRVDVYVNNVRATVTTWAILEPVK
jgi:CSLREA domain-containing protein